MKLFQGTRDAMVPHENCVEIATHTIWMSKSCSWVHPQQSEFQRHLHTTAQNINMSIFFLAVLMCMPVSEEDWWHLLCMFSVWVVFACQDGSLFPQTICLASMSITSKVATNKIGEMAQPIAIPLLTAAMRWWSLGEQNTPAGHWSRPFSCPVQLYKEINTWIRFFLLHSAG